MPNDRREFETNWIISGSTKFVPIFFTREESIWSMALYYLRQIAITYGIVRLAMDVFYWKGIHL